MKKRNADISSHTIIQKVVGKLLWSLVVAILLLAIYEQFLKR